MVAGVEYEVDCIIYASGFEVGTAYTRRTGFDMTGRDGVKLSEYWADGMRTKHGIHVHGFPNAFIVQPTQGANLISNVPHNLTEAGKTIAMIVKHALDNGAREVEVTKEAEDAWIELLLSGPGRGMIGSPDCTPGYYNNEGQPPGPASDFFVGYPTGAMAYFQYLDAVAQRRRLRGPRVPVAGRRPSGRLSEGGLGRGTPRALVQVASSVGSALADLHPQGPRGEPADSGARARIAGELGLDPGMDGRQHVRPGPALGAEVGGGIEAANDGDLLRHCHDVVGCKDPSSQPA